MITSLRVHEIKGVIMVKRKEKRNEKEREI